MIKGKVNKVKKLHYMKILFSIVILVVWWLIGFGSTQQTKQKVLSSTERSLMDLIAKSKWAEVEKISMEWRKSDPKNPLAIWLFYWACVEQKKIKEASITGIELDLCEKKQRKEAIFFAKQLVNAYGKNEISWVLLGHAQVWGDENEVALRSTENALSLNYRCTIAWLIKGVALSKMGRHKESIKCFDKIIGINPNCIEAWFYKGNDLTKMRCYDDAIKCYEKAILISPDFAEVWIGKGAALFMIGKSKEALECFDKAIKIYPNYAGAWYNKGITLRHMGYPKDAIKCYNVAINIKPDYTEAWVNKGVALKKIGCLADALKCYENAIKINSNHASAWLNKGNILWSMNNANEAIKCFDKALRINPMSSDTWHNKGLVLGHLDRNEESIKCFDKAIEINSNDAKAWCNKGVILYKLKRYKDAKVCFKNAVELDHSQAQRYLRILERKIRDGSKSFKFRKRPMSLSPYDVREMIKKYDFYCKKDDLTEIYCNPKGKGIPNEFELRKNGKVVCDKATGLMWMKGFMWQHGGSFPGIPYKDVKKWMKDLNKKGFAGYHDWRLPTLEEAMSLMEHEKKGDSYMDPIFDEGYKYIWTCDQAGYQPWLWVVDFGSQARCVCGGYFPTNPFIRAVRYDSFTIPPIFLIVIIIIIIGLIAYLLLRFYSYLKRPRVEIDYSQEKELIYAGFWLRFVAFIIDAIILIIIMLIIVLIIGIIVGLIFIALGIELSQSFLYSLGFLMFYIITWLYFTILESSSYQATIGKMVIGIIVTDINCKQISFGRANGRYWSKFLSAIVLYTGFIFAGFTSKKQALHDIMSECLVLKKYR